MNISHAMASRLTEVARGEIEKWKMWLLVSRYPVIFVGGTYFPVRRGFVSKEVIYVMVGIRGDGRREILAYEIGGEGESARVWKELLRQIKERGVEEVEIIVGDGLVGLKEAIAEVYSESRYQHCVMHAVRNTLVRVKVRDRSEIVRCFPNFGQQNAMFLFMTPFRHLTVINFIRSYIPRIDVAFPCCNTLPIPSSLP